MKQVIVCIGGPHDGRRLPGYKARGKWIWVDGTEAVPEQGPGRILYEHVWSVTDNEEGETRHGVLMAGHDWTFCLGCEVMHRADGSLRCTFCGGELAAGVPA